MKREETEVLPLAEQFLTSADWDEIDEAAAYTSTGGNLVSRPNPP